MVEERGVRVFCSLCVLYLKLNHEASTKTEEFFKKCGVAFQGHKIKNLIDERKNSWA